MTTATLALLAASLFAIAFLYSSVGHAGASGYIAAMALAGLAPMQIKPMALVLNILVACLSTFQYCRAGYFSWRLFLPFALLAVPCAFLGGYVHLPSHAFNLVLSGILLYSGLRFLVPSGTERTPKLPRLAVSLSIGGVLGFIAGLVGVGGGIFLTPVLILFGWARTKTAAAVSAAFILVNSVAGLAGYLFSGRPLSMPPVSMAVAVILGGALGSYLGSHRFPVSTVQRLLACVLLMAAAKLVVS